MFGTFTWLLNLPFACSGPGGWFALQQSGEIVWVSFELGIAITIAIAAGNVLRRRPSLRLLSAVVFVLFIPGCSGIGGGSDCGYFARELCYGNLGILAALCTGEFLFWKRTSFLLAASRLKSRHLESGTRIGPDTDEYFSPDDAVTMTPPPLMVAETSSRTSLVQDIQSWDEAAGSADRGNETTPPPHRWQIRWKLSRVKALLSLAIGLVVALTARVVVPDWLAPNQYHFDVPLAVHLRCLPLCQQNYRKKTGDYSGSMQSLVDANVIPTGGSFGQAFETCQGNRDAQPATFYPFLGYRFRILHGTAVDPVAWCFKGNPEILSHWAVIARRFDPRVNAYYQLLLLESGDLYKHAEPPPGDPCFNAYLLDGLPDVLQPDGRPDPVKLQALGWTLVRPYFEMEDLEKPQ